MMITLNAVGDIILTDKMSENSALDEAAYLFRDVQHTLSEADFTIGNLEGPLSNGGTPYNDINKEFLLRASPDYVKSLKAAGFNIICLANNHILDYGSVALQETIRTLKDHDISYIGAG